jgi:hypothetical protein
MAAQVEALKSFFSSLDEERKNKQLNRRIKHQKSVEDGLINVDDYACAYCEQEKQAFSIIKFDDKYRPFCYNCTRNINAGKFESDFFIRIKKFDNQQLKIPEKVLVDKIEEITYYTEIGKIVLEVRVCEVLEFY